MKHKDVKKNNKKWYIKNIFIPFKQNNIKLKYVKFFSGYFIWFLGKASILHFIVKGIDDIKFGIWKLEKNKVQLFAEFIPYINKFKPSQSFFEFNSISELINFINSIKNSKCYNEKLIELLRQSDYFHESDSDEYIMKCFLEDKKEIL